MKLGQLDGEQDLILYSVNRVRSRYSKPVKTEWLFGNVVIQMNV